jgi:small nuclear ribonucleoprotein (snRNP)-like protein
MEENKSFLNEFIGKKVLVHTKGGPGIKDVISTEGSYRGMLIGFDGNFIKLEYDVAKFVNGKSENVKERVIINLSYIITLEEGTNIVQ